MGMLMHMTMLEEQKKQKEAKKAEPVETAPEKQEEKLPFTDIPKVQREPRKRTPVRRGRK